MGYTWENDCVGCERCANCGRREDYKQYYCDKCEEVSDADNPLYVGQNGEDLCWDCYKAQYTEKICDDMDETKCAHCGNETEYMYLVDGEWMCEDCLMERAERVQE